MTTDRRQQLIDAARRRFAAEPYDRVTTVEIAKEAGVAYGLIAHHFGNKRGLYQAVMHEIADEIAAVQQDPPPPDAGPLEQLRHALRLHVAYIDARAASFVTLVRGHLGPDLDQQAALDELRWLGARRILRAAGIDDPIPPVLRIAMKGWIGYLDEMMVDRINTGVGESEVVVELATAALVSTLWTVQRLDSDVRLDATVAEALDTYPGKP